MFDEILDSGSTNFTGGWGDGAMFGPPVSATNNVGFGEQDGPPISAMTQSQGGGNGIIDQMGGWGNALKAGGGLLSTLFSRNDANKNRAALQQVANQQNDIYNRLQQTYTNPGAYLNSPEAQAIRAGEAQKVARAAAASGRRSQVGAQMNLVDQAMMNHLENYRKGIAGTLDPRAQFASTQQAITRNPNANVVTGLMDLFKQNPQIMSMVEKAIPAVGGAILGGAGSLFGNGGGLGDLFGSITQPISDFFNDISPMDAETADLFRSGSFF